MCVILSITKGKLGSSASRKAEGRRSGSGAVVPVKGVALVGSSYGQLGELGRALLRKM